MEKARIIQDKNRQEFPHRKPDYFTVVRCADDPLRYDVVPCRDANAAITCARSLRRLEHMGELQTAEEPPIEAVETQNPAQVNNTKQDSPELISSTKHADPRPDVGFGALEL